MALRTGKLPPALLKKLLEHRGAKDTSVVLGPGIGEDAAVVRLAGTKLVLKTDPVTYTTDMIGWYAVHVNANDIATRGARPKWFQAVILLPEGSDEKVPVEIARQISSAAKGLGVAVTGGHTEVTPGISHPIVVGDMHGLLVGKKVVTSGGAREGDSIVLTKGAGIEGTAAIARDMRSDLLKAFDRRFVDRAARFIYDPGLSIVPDAMLALKFGVTAMHDPTEGGVLMGVHELAEASRKSVELDADRVPVREETTLICSRYGIDPLGLLGSGALLATFRPADAERYVRAAKKARIRAEIVGRVLSKRAGSKMIRDGAVRPLSSSERDEVLKVLG